MHISDSRRCADLLSAPPVHRHISTSVASIGTLITINRDTDLTFTAPIATWLERRDTSLRTSADPSLLLHALLDLTVDRALEVVDEYHARILQLEHDTLLLPRMRVVRDLHILQGDLIQHKQVFQSDPRDVCA